MEPQFTTYPCRFDRECGSFNPAITVPITIKGIDGPKTIQKLNNCTHGGGCACDNFKRIVENKIFLEGGIH